MSQFNLSKFISDQLNKAGKNKLLLSIIFSFRNEEEVLNELIHRTRKVLKEETKKDIISNYELIFVNDASDDSSLKILLEQANNNDIKIINMSRRFGVSPCVIAGMEHATGDAVIYMDADLQDPPEIIPEMLKAWQSEENVDVVHTIRVHRKKETIIKMLITKLGYFILNKITSVQLPIEAGDFKLLSRRAVKEIIKMKEKRPFTRGMVCWIGFKQLYVHYTREPRFAGKTKFPIFSFKVISNFFTSALISFSSVPLKIASYLGIAAIFVDLLLTIHVISEKLQGKAIPGWTAIMIAVLFIGSIQLLCIGIIGLYINTIYEETKNRPNYIIESTYGF